jgi:hypothetical protein
VNSKVRKNHEFVVNVLKAKKWDQSNLRNWYFEDGVE